MKILYVISSTETGGAEKSLYHLALLMHSSGHTVRVLCLRSLGALAAALQEQGVEVKSLAGAVKLPGQIARKIRREIKNFSPDLVHAMLFRAMVYARMACAGLPVKLVTTPHFNLAKKTVLHRWIDFLFKGQDTLTVAESYTTARYLVQHQHYQKNKVFLLPNGVDKTKFYKDINIKNLMREKHGFHVKTLVFLCVARLSVEKNPLILLQAFRNVLRTNPDCKLIYVGEGAERIKLERYIKQSNMQDAVLLAGEQTNINDWLNMADIFVLPSLEESLPIALLEALCTGLPCIVSSVGDMPLWVEHGKNGYVFSPTDLTLLSCFMNELSSNDALRKEMGQKSLEKATSLGDTFQQYHQLYQQIISNSFHVKTKEKE